MADVKYSNYDRSIKGRFRNLRNHAKRHKKTLTLTLNEYTSVIENPCHYCDGYFTEVFKAGGLDRIDNSIGYEPGNVLPCCRTCNVTRNNNFTVDETKAMIQLLIVMRESE